MDCLEEISSRQPLGEDKSIRLEESYFYANILYIS